MSMEFNTGSVTEAIKEVTKECTGRYYQHRKLLPGQ